MLTYLFMTISFMYFYKNKQLSDETSYLMIVSFFPQKYKKLKVKRLSFKVLSSTEHFSDL